jgi:hypothetical protein
LLLVAVLVGRQLTVTSMACSLASIAQLTTLCTV